MRDDTPENDVSESDFTCGITSPGAAFCAAPNIRSTDDESGIGNVVGA